MSLTAQSFRALQDGHAWIPAFVEQVQNMEGVEKLLPLYVFENGIQAGKTVSPDQENNITFTRLEGTDNP